MAMDCRSNGTSKLKVLMLPYLAHGHVRPFVELAKQLSQSNFHVYICSTPIILESIKKETPEFSIDLILLHLPFSPDLPPYLHTTAGLPIKLQPTLIHSFQSCGPNFSIILDDIKPDLVLYDLFCQWVPPLTSALGIPAVHTVTSSAAATSYAIFLDKRRAKNDKEGKEFTFPDILLAGPYEKDDKDEGGVEDNDEALEVEELNDFTRLFDLSCNIILIKGCSTIEEKYINYLSELTGKEVVAMGPLVRPPCSQLLPTSAYESRILQWLDNKEPFSTVFVSFGSEFYMKKEEVEELAYGLEISNINFIWVVRFPTVVVEDEGDDIRDPKLLKRDPKVKVKVKVRVNHKKKPMSVEEAMPSGFLERVKANGRGFIVDGWAPQTRVLSHGNLGGFVSHCGWGSTTESMYFGVPIIAMPRMYDQPIVARLVEEVGVGVEVLRDENGNYKSGMVAKAIKEVVGTRGDEFRSKAKEVGDRLRKEGDDASIAVAKQVTRLCQMKL